MTDVRQSTAGSPVLKRQSRRSFSFVRSTNSQGDGTKRTTGEARHSRRENGSTRAGAAPRRSSIREPSSGGAASCGGHRTACTLPGMNRWHIRHRPGAPDRHWGSGGWGRETRQSEKKTPESSWIHGFPGPPSEHPAYRKAGGSIRGCRAHAPGKRSSRWPAG